MKYEANRYELIQVAQGKQFADMFLRNGLVVNVYSGEILPCHVAIYKDRIAYVGASERSIGRYTKIIDCSNKYVVPGYIEPHAHPWVFYNPVSLTEKVLPLGTTTVIHDNLFFYLHMGAKGFANMLTDLKGLPGNHLWLVRLVSQARYPGERDWFHETDIRSLLELDDVIGTAEVTRWPLLYQGDPFVIETVEYAKSLGKVSDGHTSGCSYDRLNSIVAAGISACHEAITAGEVLDRVRLGLWTTLRNSSLRPDLPEIIKSITEGTISTNRILMTTDGPNPGFIEEYGFVDGLLRQAVELGLPPIQALQMVTINAATYLGLEQHIGGIAPARRADVLVLPDLVSFRPETVIAGGQVVAESGNFTQPLPKIDWLQHIVKQPFTVSKQVVADANLYPYPLRDENSSIPVIDFLMAVITKQTNLELPCHNGYADISEYPDLVYAALIDRDGKWVSHAILKHFANRLDGMASTYNTTTHLLVIGRNPKAMAKAAVRVYEMGGGIAVIDGEASVLEIPLPFTGMMTTDSSFATALQFHDALLDTLRQRGYPFHDILYTLLFLTCDCLPGLRLTPEGIYHVKSDTVIISARNLQVTTISY
ncbi:amidohydrolase family protein [Fodinisporobacter ferrooxydans]|uniref:adenine deaminase n=1 Tax=Fodinisporobacter ferrooxydans TaxID=2901836 RepID=A0ABY4CJI5_9BACL|nr:amidohydrolase family protein [Alicyclobacillaceae bacterium MYW30-H2]